MNALVTGATGFLGLCIVEQLVTRGYRVRAFCRRATPQLESLGVEIVQGDIRDPQAVGAACRDIETVFHTAAIAGIWGPWKLFHETNTLGTRHVVAGCLVHRVKKLILTSSPSVTFDGRDQCGVDESVPYARRWLAHYPHSKALAEQHVLAANGLDGLLTCALRPHLIWGPRDRHLIPRLLERQRQGQLRRVGDGTNLIDTIYVENAAAAHLQAADALKPGSPVCGSKYFLSQGEPVKCWDWIDEIVALADLPPVQRQIGLSTAYGVGAILEATHKILRLRGEPRMTRFLALQLGRSHYFDISRAKRDFGYHPRVSTAEGMQRLKSWLPLAKPPQNR
jgi:nucleoside-diphosphate-sugar epimerase